MTGAELLGALAKVPAVDLTKKVTVVNEGGEGLAVSVFEIYSGPEAPNEILIRCTTESPDSASGK